MVNLLFSPPTDAVIEAFDTANPGTLDALLADVDQLRSILLYHVLPGLSPAEQVVAAAELPTALDGASLVVRVNDNGVFINNAGITETDTPASNGLFHVIDGLLLPTDRCQNNAGCGAGFQCSDVGLCTQRAAGNLLQELAAAGEFTTLLAAIDAAGLRQTLENIASGTILAPTDQAFADLEDQAPGIIDSLLEPDNVDLLQGILLSHTIIGGATREDIERQARLLNARPSYLNVNLDGGGAVQVGGATVLEWDRPASNGWIHSLNSVIRLQADVSRGTCSRPLGINGLGSWVGAVSAGAATHLATCGDAAVGPEHVFSWTSANAEPVCINTFGSTVDTVLHIRTGVCASRRFELACSDDVDPESDLTSRIELNAEAGVNYYIFVDMFDLENVNDRFILDIRSGPCRP